MMADLWGGWDESNCSSATPLFDQETSPSPLFSSASYQIQQDQVPLHQAKIFSPFQNVYLQSFWDEGFYVHEKQGRAIEQLRSGPQDAKKDIKDIKKNIKHIEKELDTFCVSVNTQFANINNMIKDMDNKLTLIEYKQNFMQAFALQSTVKVMKAINGEGDKEEIKKCIKDVEGLMECIEHGGEGCGENKV
ncbi:hypothetical protein L873DRAFT_1845015 [Choiromyces venosus 120613-1]|uniref:Uncharacterized protein n=1 Tax=Choiromyces venosus 120613-1 TaxID=1336337 RepID=A0A3N4JFU1_9PEZI|nr:hypothetical protein L873DRAFT_1845015 [Choiromyces venosus 120613-1]